MTGVELRISGDDRLELTRALLVYESATSGSMATLHEVLTPEGGEAFLLPGQCLTAEALEMTLRKISGQAARREILPERVLCADGALMAWWVPSAGRPIFFATADKAFNARFVGSLVLHPPLVMVAEAGRLSVFALNHSSRPDAGAALYRAPYFNLYDGGQMCAGNARLPESPVPGEIALWEKAFFETNFTHANLQKEKLTTHEGGHNGYWLPRRSPFTAEKDCFRGDCGDYLVPLNMTLEEVVNR